jgi:hypothetical protein
MPDQKNPEKEKEADAKPEIVRTGTGKLAAPLSLRDFPSQIWTPLIIGTRVSEVANPVARRIVASFTSSINSPYSAVAGCG